MYAIRLGNDPRYVSPTTVGLDAVDRSALFFFQFGQACFRPASAISTDRGQGFPTPDAVRLLRVRSTAEVQRNSPPAKQGAVVVFTLERSGIDAETSYKVPSRTMYNWTLSSSIPLGTAKTLVARSTEHRTRVGTLVARGTPRTGQCVCCRGWEAADQLPSDIFDIEHASRRAGFAFGARARLAVYF